MVIENQAVRNRITIKSIQNRIKDHPNAQLNRTAAQNIPNSAVTNIDWTAVAGLRSEWADFSTDRITPTMQGYYLVNLYTSWAVDNVNTRWATWTGVFTILNKIVARNAAADNTECASAGIALFNGTTDWIGAQVFQDSGGALNLIDAYLSVTKLGF